MDQYERVNSCNFRGPLAAELTAFLTEKRGTRHKYITEAYHLEAIDKFSLQRNTDSHSLPKEFVDAWTQKSEYESHKTWQNRVVVIRQFARFLNAQGISAHESALIIRSKRSDFIPHIYTDSELRRIFEEADHCPVYTNCPNRRMVASLLFRLIYACGLRISEALSLNVGHVDLENGVLTILNSKFGTNRYVPMSEDLVRRCRFFVESIHLTSESNCPFFPAPDGSAYSKRTITHMFHQVLQQAGIPRTNRNPRIHDFRHTFAVNCLKKWVRSGKDLTAMLPVLSTYLGHKGLTGTQDYLRLTADMFPDITASVEVQFGHVVPKGGFTFEEE